MLAPDRLPADDIRFELVPFQGAEILAARRRLSDESSLFELGQEGGR